MMFFCFLFSSKGVWRQSHDVLTTLSFHLPCMHLMNMYLQSWTMIFTPSCLQEMQRELVRNIDQESHYLVVYSLQDFSKMFEAPEPETHHIGRLSCSNGDSLTGGRNWMDLWSRFLKITSCPCRKLRQKQKSVHCVRLLFFVPTFPAPADYPTRGCFSCNG